MSRQDAVLLAKEGKVEEAKAEFESVRDWKNLSVMLAREGRYSEAKEVALRLISSDPLAGYIQAMAVCWEAGWWDEVAIYINKGLLLSPDDPGLRCARGAYRLARGDQRGWEDLEFRPWLTTLRATCDEFPEWDGKTSLKDKAILIHYQDGHGDRVMYSRFLNQVKEKFEPKRIVLFTSHDTCRLFTESFPDIEVVSHHEAIGQVDCWIGLSSLGKLGLPISGAPYLTVPDERRYARASHLRAGNNLRVGLVWAGNAKHTQDHTRSLPFDWFGSLLKLSGIDFYSLQFEEHNLDHKGQLNELSVYCRDTADTLAAISNLDLVIGVDTGMIHFAGAIGVPAWVLCRTPVDWRWGLEGGKCYWYDSVKILRNYRVEELFRKLIAYRDIHKVEKREQPPPVLSTTRHFQCRYGTMEIYRYDLWTSRALEEYGEWSEGEVELFRSIVKQSDVVLEAGSHIGAHTLPLSMMCAELHAFEPVLEFNRLLRKNVKELDNVLVHDVALGATEELAYINPPDMSCVQAAGTVEVQYQGQVEIRIKSVDSYNFIKLDFIKADIEGSELALLEGAEDTIKRCRPLLYLENHYEEQLWNMLKLLDSWGYRLYEHKIPLYNPNNFSSNKVNVFGMLDSKMILAVPKERYDLRPVTNKLLRLRLQNGS